MRVIDVFKKKDPTSKVMTVTELKEKRSKMLNTFKQRTKQPKSTDAIIWSSAFESNEIAYVAQNGSYRFKNNQGPCQRFYDSVKNRPTTQLWSNESSVMKELYNHFKTVVGPSFPEGISLDDAISIMLDGGMYQMGHLALRHTELPVICDDWKPGSLDIEDDYWRMNLGDNLQTNFAICIRLYSFFMRYYFTERGFINKIALSSVDEIQVMLDIYTEEITDENLAPWLTLRETIAWKVHPVVKWVTQNDEVTRSLITKSDFSIKHSNNWVPIFRSFVFDQNEQTYFSAQILRANPVNKMIIKVTSGSNIEVDLFKINYKNDDVINFMNTWNEAYTFQAAGSKIVAGSQEIPIYLQAVVFDFIGENLNTPVTAIMNTSRPQTGPDRYYLYFNNYSDNSSILKTLPFVQTTKNSKTFEVTQTKLASAAYNTISVVTYDGQQVTVIPFQLHNSEQGNYEFSAITDSIRFIDAVYVLGNKI